MIHFLMFLVFVVFLISTPALLFGHFVRKLYVHFTKPPR